MYKERRTKRVNIIKKASNCIKKVSKERRPEIVKRRPVNVKRTLVNVSLGVSWATSMSPIQGVSNVHDNRG